MITWKHWWLLFCFCVSITLYHVMFCHSSLLEIKKAIKYLPCQVIASHGHWIKYCEHWNVSLVEVSVELTWGYFSSVVGQMLRVNWQLMRNGEVGIKIVVIASHLCVIKRREENGYWVWNLNCGKKNNFKT